MLHIVFLRFYPCTTLLFGDSSGMKQYLNDYHDGIILKYNHKYNIPEYENKQCFDLIGSDDAIEKPITCGFLRTYCSCDVVKWKHDINIDALIANKQEIKCISCNKMYEESIANKTDDDFKNDTNEKEYWIQGISQKHNNLRIFLCGKCIITLIIEGTDREQVDIYQYLTDSLTNNRKITELCLVHRLFATSSQLMQLLINSFCQNMEESDTAGMLKVINFVIKWVNFYGSRILKKSKARLLLNKFISFLLEQTNGKNDYGAIWKATQKLLAHYRDQYLLQQQIESELEANLKNDVLISPKLSGKKGPKNMRRISSISPNITSRAQLQNNLNSYFSDDYDSDETQYSHHDLYNGNTNNNQNEKPKLPKIPEDLAWYQPKNDETKQKFFHYVLQKRNSIDQFRKYKTKEVQIIKKTKSMTVNVGADPNDVDISLNRSMPFKSMRNSKTNRRLKRHSSKSIHFTRMEADAIRNPKSKNNKHRKAKRYGSDTINVIKSYELIIQN